MLIKAMPAHEAIVLHCELKKCKARLHDKRFGYGTLKFGHPDPFIVPFTLLIYDGPALTTGILYRGTALLKIESFMYIS